jgi:site-specific recombinase XerD
MIDDMYQPIALRNSVLAEHISMFDSHIRKTASAHTAETYSRSLRCFLSFVIQDRKFKFRIKDFERYKFYLKDTKQLQSSSIATYITSLRRFSKYLVDTKVLPRNPGKHIHVDSIKKSKELSFFSHDELQVFFQSIDTSNMQGKRDKALFMLMLACMCREEDLQHAVIGDVDFVFDIMTIPSKKKSKTIPLPLPEHVISLLKEYVQYRFPEGAPPDAPLFHSMSNRSKGKAISVRGIRETFKQRLKTSGIAIERCSDLSPYALRHTAGCILAVSGFEIDYMMQFMRLSSQSIIQRYLEIAELSQYSDLRLSLTLIQ